MPRARPTMNPSRESASAEASAIPRTSNDDAFLWRVIFPNLRRQERERFRFLALLAGVVMLAQTVGLAGADALFLSGYGAGALPRAFILASLAAVAGSVAYTFVVGRTRNDKLFVRLSVGTGVILIASAALLFAGHKWTLYIFFSAIYVTQAVFVSLHYPTLAADYFDTVSSKRVFPYLIGCASFGGIVGGLLALGLVRVVRSEWLLVAWGVFHLVAALMLVAARRDLKRWIPVGPEADEASAEGMLGAMRFLRRSALSRWLMIAVIGIVFSAFLMQYVEMGIIAASFHSPAALASFLAIYLAVASGVEILIASVVVPALIRRFGVAQANLVHPLLTVGVFLLLAFKPTLASGVVGRANRELMENALAGPLRALLYNALAFRFRGRMRAFLDGIVFYAAMAAAGVALAVMPASIDPMRVCWIGVGAGLLYLGASWMVRRKYLESIVDELRSGRLDLEAVGSGLGEVEITRLAEQWEASLSNDSPPARGWRELPSVLIRHKLREPLERNARRGHPVIRVACIEALATDPTSTLDPILAEALADEDASVRLAACVAAQAPGERSAALDERLLACLGDRDARIRARAAALLGVRGVETLRAMAWDPAPAVVVEALSWLPVALLSEARQRLDDPAPAVRAGALACIARLGDGASLSLERLERSLGDDEAVVRLAAVDALGTLGEEIAPALLARALDDRNRAVRARSSQALGQRSEAGVAAAAPAAASIRRWTADAAIQAVARAGGESARAVLESVFRQRVADAWEARVSRELIPLADDVATRFLSTALSDSYDVSCWVALRALEFLEDPIVVRSVGKALDYSNARDRGDALEVLSNLGERAISSQFALLLEDGPLEDKLSSLPSTLHLPTTLEQVLDRASESDDRWIKLAVAARRFLTDASLTQEVRTMEGLLALRRVPLFAHLSLEQLEAIGHFMKEARYLKGEVVVREGDVGEDLFVIVEGEAVASKHYGTREQIELTTMNPGGICYFGEIAIFDRAARSATVVVTKDARLLRLGGERFTELIIQSPEIAFEIFKVFSQRLRVAEERLRAQEDRERQPATGASQI